MNYKVVMAYDGSRYNGWQKQGNTDKTIQGKLEQILLKMTGEEIEVHGSGLSVASVCRCVFPKEEAKIRWYLLR